ncbi:gliding motility-associated peptidyl-prolyl isomerase GldI [Flavobacteriaceae bacterium AU392]|nr:gliding motility-associated peptidyl-prolyl isomerase GldI [Flavobacteriaceae bacterium]RKM83682.1 gliding motility-associated peptidyl-prolyl isomerase GldI [Flavobacteriaceae bacterium AU392]
MKKIIILLLCIVSVLACKTPEARRPISVKTGSFIDQSIALNKKLNASQHKQIQDIIALNPEVNYIASENGFWYYYNTKIEENTITPAFGDIVNFNYNVSNINNELIYSEEDLKPQDYAIDQEELFSGLREGLKLMKAGETITFLFPSQKAYGFYGDNNQIEGNSSIICKVTLNTITQKEVN